MKQCNGCGDCCKLVTCAVGQFYYHISKNERCPGLIWKDGRYWCELILKHIKVPELLKVEIDINSGCCVENVKKRKNERINIQSKN